MMIAMEGIIAVAVAAGAGVVIVTSDRDITMIVTAIESGREIGAVVPDGEAHLVVSVAVEVEVGIVM